MQTVPVAEKNVKAYCCTVYDEPVKLVEVNGIIYVVTEDDVRPFQIEMTPFTCVLGEVGLADTQHILDAIVRRGPAAIACGRAQEVA